MEQKVKNIFNLHKAINLHPTNSTLMPLVTTLIVNVTQLNFKHCITDNTMWI